MGKSQLINKVVHEPHCERETNVKGTVKNAPFPELSVRNSSRLIEGAQITPQLSQIFLKFWFRIRIPFTSWIRIRIRNANPDQSAGTIKNLEL